MLLLPDKYLPLIIVAMIIFISKRIGKNISENKIMRDINKNLKDLGRENDKTLFSALLDLNERSDLNVSYRMVSVAAEVERKASP